MMQKKTSYIEDEKSYYRKRYVRWLKRKTLKKIVETALALTLAAAVGGAAAYVVLESGGPSGIERVYAQNEEIVSGGDMGEVQAEPMMDGRAMGIEKEEAYATVSGGDCGWTSYLAQNVKNVAKEPEELLIVVDAGHGGEDEGCARNGVREKDINLQIACLLQEKLTDMGYQVLMTRDADSAVSLDERVAAANGAGADLYVSIHQNACEVQDPKGMEVWYCTQGKGGESERLARLLNKFVIQSAGMEDRGICETDTLRVLRESTMPACLVETGFLSNPSERAELEDKAYQDKIASGIADAIELYFFPKTMYLTFDDGPSAENTVAVLDILKERGISATFFVIGQSVRNHPEVAQRIVVEGHTIGIHCNNHAYEELYASADSYMEDFWEAYEAVYEVTGVEAKLFRFPGGSINSFNGDVYEEIVERMTEEGFIYYDWNASLEDAVKKADPEELVENGVSSTLSRKRVIMLAHDVVYATTLCLEDLLDALPEYRMEPLTEDVEPIQFGGK
ncbi:MAG: N-acetylmuramoyl-L-alanine amidase [Candidatus Gastranaerophilales bacterium]|nr:N-acetylmuramoyl-L-alanine amidase [Candidatus Gastranaerophilales bacterium]